MKVYDGIDALISLTGMDVWVEGDKLYYSDPDGQCVVLKRYEDKDAPKAVVIWLWAHEAIGTKAVVLPPSDTSVNEIVRQIDKLMESNSQLAGICWPWDVEV